MREILFRGKRTDNGLWIFGDGIHYPKSYNWKGTCWIAGMREKANDWRQVIPETVGQYTGLTDKNNFKIFEHDILESSASENQEDWKQWRVLFEDGGFVFERIGVKPKRNKCSDPEKYLLCEDEINLYGLVIIGTIHDNPELAGGKKK